MPCQIVTLLEMYAFAINICICVKAVDFICFFCFYVELESKFVSVYLSLTSLSEKK